MKPESSFIGSKCTVEFHTYAPVDLYFAFIIMPGHFKEDDAFGLGKPVDEADRVELRMPVVYLFDAFKDFPDGLQKFFFARIFLFKAADYIVRIHRVQILGIFYTTP